VAKEDNVKVSDGLTIPADELTWRFGPSGGPGGQHANTSNTRVELVFEIVESAALSEDQRRILTDVFGPRLRIVSDQARSQTRNRQVATERLVEKLRVALKPRRTRRPTKPSRGSKERRLRAKRQQSQQKAQRRNDYDD
jgi:ribosome-associated protein